METSRTGTVWSATKPSTPRRLWPTMSGALPPSPPTLPLLFDLSTRLHLPLRQLHHLGFTRELSRTWQALSNIENGASQ